MDVLAPPGNRWLMELSRLKTDLPVGVRIVCFGEDQDDLFDEREKPGAQGGHQRLNGR